MLTSDRQILKLPEMLKSKGKIEYIKEFYEQTGIPKDWFSAKEVWEEMQEIASEAWEKNKTVLKRNNF